MTIRKVPNRGFNLDYVMWLFMRLSALGLYIVGLTALTGALIQGARTGADVHTIARWTFFPNYMHVYSSDMTNVESGLLLWTSLQYMAIFFGVTHGMNGLRIVVEDFMGTTNWRHLWRAFIFFLWIFIIFVGISLVQ